MVRSVLRSRRHRDRGCRYIAPSSHVGEEIVARSFYEIDYLHYVRQIIGSQPSTATILDIGANIGNHAVYFSQYGYSVLSFEPNAEVFLVLQANVSAATASESIRTFAFGLGARDELVDFYIPLGGRTEWATCSAELARGFPARKTTVDIRRGDSVLASEGVFPDQVALIKIDVEGAELSVLLGLRDFLSSYNGWLWFEHGAGPDRERILEYLAEIGFSVFIGAVERARFLPKTWNISTWKLFKFIFGSDIKESRISAGAAGFYPCVLTRREGVSTAGAQSDVDSPR